MTECEFCHRELRDNYIWNEFEKEYFNPERRYPVIKDGKTYYVCLKCFKDYWRNKNKKNKDSQEVIAMGGKLFPEYKDAPTILENGIIVNKEKEVIGND